MAYAIQPFRRLVLVLALVGTAATSTGCTYRPATLAISGHEQKGESGESVVDVGSTVRVKLLSGESLGGTILSVTSEQIELGNRGNYGHENVTIQLADVDRIEVREQSDGLIESAWFVGILVGLSALVLAGLRATY